MKEENFNWLETFIEIQNNKDIKTSNDFKILNSNNIDTNELTKHEQDNDAGVVELNYKDEKVKETDGYNYTKGALAFLRDMPEETVKSLMLAFLNGVDVTANFSAVVLNAMVSVDPAMEAAFQNKDVAEFKKSFNSNVQKFSKYLDGEAATPDSKNIIDNHFDIIFDSVGLEITRQQAIKKVRPGGVIIHIGLTQPSGSFDFRKATLQEITFIGTNCYTNKDFEKTLSILANKKIGRLDWIEYRKLKDGATAFKQIHNGTCSAPKIILLI